VDDEGVAGVEAGQGLGGDRYQPFGVDAHHLRGIFAGHAGPPRDVVVMNAAAVLVTAGLAADFLAGTRLAQDTIDSGKVEQLVALLAEWPKGS
jgi:anthranilate phosphoribosyltransferase